MSDSTTPAPRRRNMKGEERERQILEEAVRFFAECGFEGQTRGLAKRLGISHAVIYRHFDSKEALIERVYEHVYTNRWRDDWAGLVRDRSLPLLERLVRFYRQYVETVFAYDWVRIFLYSGLNSYGLPERYLGVVGAQIIRPAVLEARHEQGLPQRPPSSAEQELFWALHGSVFYLAIRRYVYQTATPADIAATAEQTVRAFLPGICAQMPQLSQE